MNREKKLVSPKILEAIGRQRRIAHGGHDRAVAEISLDGARVMAVVRELEPTGMPQHVRMNEEGEFRNHAHAEVTVKGTARAEGCCPWSVADQWRRASDVGALREHDRV
jgi:hypothetical protein